MTAPAARSTTPTLLLPNSATNRRLRGRSMAMWSIRPATFPSAIFASRRNGCATGSAVDPRTVHESAATTAHSTIPVLRIRLALRARGLVDRRTQPLRQFDCVVVGPEVHEDEAWLLGQHVAVNGG